MGTLEDENASHQNYSLSRELYCIVLVARYQFIRAKDCDNLMTAYTCGCELSNKCAYP